MARHIGLAALVAAATVALAGCTVAGPPLGHLAAETSGITQAPASATVTTSPGAGPDDTGDKNDGMIIAGLPVMPSLSVNVPDLGTISLGQLPFHGGRLPAGFPTPPGATDIGAVTVNFDVLAQMRVTDPSAAYEFWRSALPHAGYTVGVSGLAVVDNVVHAGIIFGGHGYRSTSAIAIVGNTVTIAFASIGGFKPTSGSNRPSVEPDGTLIIEDSAKHVTHACAAGAAVNIVGSADTITLTGDCGAINVVGSGNHIVADHATVVNLTGSDDDVTVHGGNPQVNKTGASDEVHIG